MSIVVVCALTLALRKQIQKAQAQSEFLALPELGHASLGNGEARRQALVRSLDLLCALAKSDGIAPKQFQEC